MTTFYVDPTATSGGDGSFASPFDSWADVSWSAGNTYLQKEETTFLGTVTVSTGGSSSSAQVIVGTYRASDGAQITDGSSRAKIDAAGGQYGILLTGTQSWISVIGMEVCNCRHTNSATGIYKATGAGTDVTISYCLVRDVYNTSTPTGSAGIKGFCDNGKVLNNVVRDMGDDGIYWEGDLVEIAYNTIKNVSLAVGSGGDCIQLFDGTISTSGVWVHHNTLDHSDVDTKQCLIIQGLSGSSGGVIEDNEIRGYSGATVNKPIYVEMPSCVVRRNFISGGIRTIDVATGGTDVVIEGNVITNSGQPANTSGVFVGTTGVVVRNNTILGQSSNASVLTAGINHFSASHTGCSFQNNIISGWRYGIRYHPTASPVENYNGLSGNGTNVVNNSLGAISAGANDVTVDPSFRADYMPLSAAVRTAGTSLGGRDYYGKEFQLPPTIGAVQHQPARSLTTRTVSTRTVSSRGLAERRVLTV